MKLTAEDFEPFTFIQRLTIIGKSGKRVRLSLTAEQITILNALLSGDDVLTLKPRQIGSSTIVAAFFTWKWYTASDPETLAIISYKLKSSKHLFNMVRNMYLSLPKFMQREMEVENSTEMKFADTGARIIAESAQSDGGIRSFTCAYAWLSEFAFAHDPAELLATASAALNNGQLILESTANYFGDALHKEVVKAQSGMSDYQFLFFPWTDHEEYSDDGWDDFEFNDEERALHSMGLSMSQLWWRRKQVRRLGIMKFRREYPLSVEEAYTLTGDSYFIEEDLQYIEQLDIEEVDGVLNILEPNSDDAYAIGVDVSAGIGRDYSVIIVMSKMHMQPAYIFRSNTISPVNLANKIQLLATKYNRAKVLVESNNMGAVVLNELRHLGYSNIWKTVDGKDWYTSAKTKTDMFEKLKKAIANGVIRNLDPLTVVELKALTVDDRHNIVLPENLDSHADSAVALALANVCALSVRLSKSGYLPDWIRKRKAERSKQRSGIAPSKLSRY